MTCVCQVTAWAVHNQMSRMAVCQLCGSLDYREVFQEEVCELSWLSQDISALYQENSEIIGQIKVLNMELENFAKQQEFYDDSSEDAANVIEALETIPYVALESTPPLRRVGD